MKYLIPAHRSRPSDDPIFALNAEAKARQAAGEAIINATVGALLDDSGALAMLPSVSAAIRDVPAHVTAGYPPIAGPPDFLRAVAQDLLGPHANLAASAATPGGTGALHHAIASFVEHGQTVLTSSFYWGPYKTLSDQQGRELATFRMFDPAGRFDVAQLERHLHQVLEAQGRALVLLNSPCHNPTGYSLDASEWSDVATAVAGASSKGPITVAIDGAYALYGARALTSDRDRILKMAEHAQVVFAWSASKSFTQYGSRVGALVAFCPDETDRKRVAAALSFACRGTWSTCNSSGMSAITRALVEPELRARVDAERAELKALLDRRVATWNEHARAAGLVFPRYDGGFFTTVLCDGAFDVGAALKQDGVFVVPQAGALRVALCSVAERDVPRLVAAIAKRLKIA
ncbi:MAG: aminotransferase class I/II-fold pyridoxal phosphate-dependent enzyme [Polyangiaceae bacterium]